jgi:hypothetical protein
MAWLLHQGQFAGAGSYQCPVLSLAKRRPVNTHLHKHKPFEQYAFAHNSYLAGLPSDRSVCVKHRAARADDEQAPGLFFFTQKPAQGLGYEFYRAVRADVSIEGIVIVAVRACGAVITVAVAVIVDAGCRRRG